MEPYAKSLRQAHISGLLLGYSQLIRFFYIGIMFYIAAVLIKHYDLDSRDVFTGVYVIFVGVIGSGSSLSQAPSLSKAQRSAQKIFGIIEERSEIDPR